MQLLILGMHRSGTSAVTRVLNMAGAYFGPEGIATDANAENPKGFWERRDVRAVCDGLLHDAGFDWWKVADFSPGAIPDDVLSQHLPVFEQIVLQLDAHRPWVMKDPRLCLLFPLLRPLLEVPVSIHVTREPLEVADSLRTRNGFPGPVGLALWERYTIDAFTATVGLPRTIVHYEHLVADPISAVRTLITDVAELGVDGLRTPTEREIKAFISSELHHEHRTAERRGLRMNEQQSRLAAVIDGGHLLDTPMPPELSEGALETLRMFEADRARRDELEEASRRDAQHARETASLEAAHARQISSHVRRISSVERELHSENRRRRKAERAAKDASEVLDRVERRVRSLSRSRALRLAAKATSIRTRGRQGAKPFAAIYADIDRARRTLESAGVTAAAAPGPRPSGRAKIAVLCWDVGHNPLGRAYVLADVLRRRFDVEIWGAQFERYGTRVWTPLRTTDLPIRPFDGRSFPEHLAVMKQLANEIDADAIWVSKPRLPSYALGVLMKQVRNRPLVLDVDDHELSFFDEDQGLEPQDLLDMRGNPDLALPFGRAWTRVCEPFIGSADQVTVSNVALRDRFGGIIVPHARDERVFDPGLYDRADTRRQLGVSDDQRLLLFGGTPREHKGVIEILRALEELGDDRYRVLLFGTREFEELRSRIGTLERWAIALPPQNFSELPRLVGAADLACVLQDPSHPVARYQLPAKITDAMAMSVPCLVRPVPPLRDLVAADVLEVLADGENLAGRIAGIFEHHDEALDRARRGRELFLAAHSYEAVSDVVAPMFERLIASPPRLAPELAALPELPRQVFSSRKVAKRSTLPPARVPGRRRRAIPPGAQYDVAMFWRQNDSGIYGRRQDMFLKYLARSGRVHTIVHFDNPTSPEALVKTYRAANTKADQSRLVVHQTVRRLVHRRDSEQIYQHTFLFGGKFTRRAGLPARKQYPDFVKSVLKRHGIGSRPLVCWVYPTNTDLPRIIDALDPDLVVADVVDDNRTWYTEDSPMYDRVTQNYADVLARSDVVLANCEPVAQSMKQFADDVHVIPNGCELPNGGPVPTRPSELQGITGPIIGYVGNLSSRVDIDLLETLARAHRDWTFVFVGSAHLDRSILRIESEPNVRFVGVKPYEQMLRFIHYFDVALIPHIDNEMTRSMNPLKAFVYCSAGVPVVSTPVANLDELSGLIDIAHGPDEFARAIERAIARERGPANLDVLRPHSWEVRVEKAIGLIDAAVGTSTGS